MTLMSPLVIETEDRLRWNPMVRALFCRAEIRKADRFGTEDPYDNVRAIKKLCSAVRLASGNSAILSIEEKIHERVRRIDPAKLDWRKFIPGAEKRRIAKAVLLKAPVSEKEKGVIFVSFENQMARLAHGIDLREFASRYHLVFSPTWSPPHDVVNCIFPKLYPDPIFCLISGTNDMEMLPRLSDRYIMVPLYASSWVHPGLFKPVPFAQKDIDICMIANFGKYKRHFLLFRALRALPKSLRVVLIGQPNGDRTAQVLMAEARSYGVEDRFQLLSEVTNDVLVDALCRSKVSLMLSRREGSCVAVVESMFANVPVGLLEDAEIGSRAFLNEHTGRILKYRNLPAQLMDFVATADTYSPRSWGENRISCVQSTQVLNEAIRKHAVAKGEQWTQDICVHHWRPEPKPVSDDDVARLKAGNEELQRKYGLTLGLDLLEPGQLSVPPGG